MGRLLHVWGVLGSWGCGSQGPTFLERESDWYVADAQMGHRHRPDARRVYDWPEHPDGRIVLKTNNLGFREDAPTAVEKAPGTRRVLVLGDSHTDGVVPNRESFANLLEARLVAAKHPVEVLNAGVGHAGPAQYAAALEAYAHLDPDAVIIVVYMGNDLLDHADAMARQGGLKLVRSGDYYDRLASAGGVIGEGLSQQLNQDFLFARNPAALPVVVGAVSALMTEWTARPSGPAVGVALLPTAFDLTPDWPGRAAAEGRLGLSAADRSPHRRLSTTWTAANPSGEARVVDLLAPLQRAPGPLFWSRDHHLSTQGHAAVADALMDAFGPLLTGTPTPGPTGASGVSGSP